MKFTFEGEKIAEQEWDLCGSISKFAIPCRDVVEAASNFRLQSIPGSVKLSFEAFFSHFWINKKQIAVFIGIKGEIVDDLKQCVAKIPNTSQLFLDLNEGVIVFVINLIHDIGPLIENFFPSFKSTLN